LLRSSASEPFASSPLLYGVSAACEGGRAKDTVRGNGFTQRKRSNKSRIEGTRCFVPLLSGKPVRRRLWLTVVLAVMAEGGEAKETEGKHWNHKRTKQPKSDRKRLPRCFVLGVGKTFRSFASVYLIRGWAEGGTSEETEGGTGSHRRKRKQQSRNRKGQLRFGLSLLWNPFRFVRLLLTWVFLADCGRGRATETGGRELDQQQRKRSNRSELGSKYPLLSLLLCGNFEPFAPFASAYLIFFGGMRMWRKASERPSWFRLAARRCPALGAAPFVLGQVFERTCWPSTLAAQ